MGANNRWHKWCERAEGDEVALGYVVVGEVPQAGEWMMSDGYLVRCPDQESPWHGAHDAIVCACGSIVTPGHAH